MAEWKPSGKRAEAERKPSGRRAEAERKPSGSQTKAEQKPYGSRSEVERKLAEITQIAEKNERKGPFMRADLSEGICSPCIFFHLTIFSFGI